MRIVRFVDGVKEAQYGIVEGDTITAATNDPVKGLKRTGSSVPLTNVRLLAPIEPVLIPKIAPVEVDYEAELALVIGKTARHVSEREAPDYVLGYTCAHEPSQKKGVE